ncbi:hypothetical protein [Pseudooceanicola aestuarii]|uniref:hypothetical protein n=1 Tax=Pseudooceanicola aestuarii TaxID=2697319 RepID=UPI0013CFE3F2|nr:hypothetical protein [Pseudooceanicola aestuarii]
MTALTEYQRLEAAGLWRADAGAQRRDVIVSLGDATLILTDMADRPLAHWSLAALTRANPGEDPAIYHPDGDPNETLELAGDEAEMIRSLDRVLASVERRRPRRGRLRLVIVTLTVLVLALAATLWLPGALQSHALSVLPQVKREEIGRQLLGEVQRLTGPACTQGGGQQALDRLAQRIAGNRPTPALRVMPRGVRTSLHLPGRVILLDRGTVENHEDPEITAGFIVAERLRSQQVDPMARLLDQTGLRGAVRLLTTGALSGPQLRRHAEWLLATPATALTDAALLKAFARAGIRSTPYALARDPSGEQVLGLIEADPFPGGSDAPILRDGDWLRLQSICSG